ncbi:glyoxylate/hydroxypyruvate reductase A [Alphaproteobacteria bacterium GH1-50]|uniref:Glyoxylate/hydroxypyruvate reductase A n=1 Tax=Kangsaoukella pontilimi TaxID=2691042 RepID=A0A7C9MLU3_9RHOB|nr:glyoxylate/hydroxypyruvate reductase A [Kangsaoukella pontilimi]MXQ09535.1 glyoxylate/hydroxypyruvate reductase A [Kangsaoukella pontilimi]
MTLVLFSAPDSVWDEYRDVLPRAIARAGVEARIIRDDALTDPTEVDYIVYAPSSRLKDFTPFTRLKAVLNLWAGVEAIAPNPTLKAPLARMVDYGLTEGMVEWCVGHTLRHHLGMDQDIRRNDAEWHPHVPPLARWRNITVLGLGALGEAVARALVDLNFRVTGWSRRQKDIGGICCLSGDDGLREALSSAEILILLLPLTDNTRDLMDRNRLALLPKGACVINPGRGPLIVDEDLIDALDSGQIAHATLDVFRTEPLPPEHPFWAHDGVTVTPHIASDTRPQSAADVVAENLRRGETGEPFLHLVDRSAGY